MNKTEIQGQVRRIRNKLNLKVEEYLTYKKIDKIEFKKELTYIINDVENLIEGLDKE